MFSSRSCIIVLVCATLAAPVLGQTASSTQVGMGCAPTAVIPTLTVTPPVLGSTAVFSVLHSFNASPIIIFVSPGAPVQVSLGTPMGFGLSCDAFVDPALALPFVNLTGVAIPAVTFALPVPASPTLAGLDLTFQALILPAAFTPAPIVTNGVHVVLGT